MSQPLQNKRRWSEIIVEAEIIGKNLKEAIEESLKPEKLISALPRIQYPTYVPPPPPAPAPAPAPVPVSQPPLRTITRRLTDVSPPALIIDESGRGELKELLILSDFKELKLVMYVDGEKVYDNDFDWFLGIAQEVVGVAAYRRLDGSYVLHITNIKFTERLKAWIHPLPTLTEEHKVREIFWKYDVAV